jgi:hypothetical protein
MTSRALEAEQREQRAAEAPDITPLIIDSTGLGLNASEVTFIQVHTHPVVKAMKPYLRDADRQEAAGQPVNTGLPVVSGTGTVGQVLTTTNGTWLNTPTFTYAWMRSGVVIAGATAVTYTLVAGDSTKAVSSVVTATKAGMSVAAPSSNSIAVT